MPEMPEWAAGARIIFDKEHNLAFIRRERRGHWEAWSYQAKGTYNEGTMTLLDLHAGSSLPKARESVMDRIGASISEFATTLHPLAGYYHIAHYIDGKGWRHCCGIPYHAYKTSSATNLADCPVCIAANLEDARAQADGLPPDKLQAATDQVRATRTMNALGAATGQDPGLTPA